MDYPIFKKKEIYDDYFGEKVYDPYQNLEKINSKEVKDWIEKQNKLTESYFSKINIKNEIFSRLKEIYHFPRTSIPFKRGDYYYCFKNSGLQNHSVLYRSEKNDKSENFNVNNTNEEIFLDPNLFEDKTSRFVSFSFSKSGKYFAYGISKKGSEWASIFIKNCENKLELEEEISLIRFDEGVGFDKVIWLGDIGFFYTRFPRVENSKKHLDSNINCKLYFHRLGENQEKDELIYENKKEPNLSFGLSISQNFEFLYIYPSFGNHLNSVIIFDINHWKEMKILKFQTILKGYEKENVVINLDEKSFYVLTNLDASNKKVIKINRKTMQIFEALLEKEYLLEEMFYFKGNYIGVYLENATSKIEIFDKGFKFKYEIKLPILGTTDGFVFNKEEETMSFGITSFIFPWQTYKFNFKTKELELFKKSEMKLDNTNFITKQVWFKSIDGTKIPMFITHKKDLKLNGQNPTILYGYGGFNIGITPSFSLGNAIFIENGGILAVPNIRGGGEFGENWHKGGICEKKQNVFDDFYMAGNFLFEKQYTSPSKLAILGGSNGGLLVGATLTQKPKFCKAIICIVGVLDMLRYHKFGAGKDWVYDYGCSNKKDGFKFLIKYSPYHNIKKINYPSTLIMTSDTDDNVVPLHSYKFAARLQDQNQSKNPILLRVEIGAGHQGGTNTEKSLKETSDRFTFIFNELEMNFIKKQ